MTYSILNMYSAVCRRLAPSPVPDEKGPFRYSIDKAQLVLSNVRSGLVDAAVPVMLLWLAVLPLSSPAVVK